MGGSTAVSGILRLHGCHTITAAPRRNARAATHLLALLGITSHETDTSARCRLPIADALWPPYLLTVLHHLVEALI
jgi:hypothetical protein